MIRKDDASPKRSTFDPVAELHGVAHRYGIPALAGMLGKSHQVMHAKLTESVENKTPSLREAVAITHHTGDLSLLSAWASAEHAMLVPLPRPQGGDDQVADELLACMETVGEFARRFKEARADGVVTPAEFKQLTKAASVVQSTLGQLVADIEQQVRELPPAAAVRTLRHG